jgi:hypothetical protein
MLCYRPSLIKEARCAAPCFTPLWKNTDMAKPKPTWTDKLNASKPVVVKPAPLTFAGMRAGQMMLIPSPKVLDLFIRGLPSGKAVDLATMRSRLARQHNAEVCCPVTTGIFLRVVVEAANEARTKGAPVSGITPVWRVVDPKAAILKKVSFDPEWMMDQRKREGL